MKKAGNYGIAFLVFVITMILMNGGAVLIAAGTAIGGGVLGGQEGVYRAQDFLLNNMNLFSCLVYLIPGVVFLLWYYFAFVEKSGTRRFFYMHTRNLSPVCFIWVILLAFAVQHVSSLVMALIQMAAPSAMDEYMEMVAESGLTEYSLMWFIATVILPPLVEEVIFRGLILQYLGRAGATFLVANLIQSVLFGIFHMNLVQGIYTTLIGFLLGYLAYRYDSILVPMALHAAYNLFGTLLVDLESRILPDMVLGLLVLVSVPLMVVILVMIHCRVGEKQPRRNSVEQTEQQTK